MFLNGPQKTAIRIPSYPHRDVVVWGTCASTNPELLALMPEFGGWVFWSLDAEGNRGREMSSPLR